MALADWWCLFPLSFIACSEKDRYNTAAFPLDIKEKWRILMRKFAYLVMAGLLMGLSLQVQAAKSNFSYNYGEVALGSIDFNGIDGTDIRVEGSFDIQPNINLIGGYDDLSLDFNVDVTFVYVGGGYHQAVNKEVDVFVWLAYLDAEINTFNDTGFMIKGGARYALDSKVELTGGARYIDIFGDTDISIFGGGRYKLGKRMSVGGGVELGDLDRLEVSFRIEF